MEPEYSQTHAVEDPRKDTPHVATPAEESDDLHPGHDDGRRKVGVVIGAAILVGLLLVVGLVPRILGSRSEAATTASPTSSLTSVNVLAVAAPAAEDSIQLPGNIDAVDQTAIVARASGYVQKWFADIGDHVKTGQTLAIIETPDLDQQLIQAQAQLASAQAGEVQMLANLSSLRAKLAEGHANVARARAALDQSRTDLERAKVGIAHGEEAIARQQAQVDQAVSAYKLAKVTSERYQGMLADGAVDQESADQAAAAYTSSQSNVDALQASLSAAREDLKADQDAVLSAQANVSAYASAVKSSEADVTSDQANVGSGQAEISAADANIRSNQANVDRLRVMQSFNRVTAPFDGVITARNIDTGTLITTSGSASGSGSSVGSSVAGAASGGNAAGGSSLEGAAGSGGSGASSLYSIARTDQLRVYINVPQAYVDVVRVGQAADVAVSALPGKTFVGKIARTADALDPVSRTLVTEIRLGNATGELRPGMFAQISLHVPHQAGSVLIPDAALVTNAAGTEVQVVDADQTVHFQPVSIGRDLGKVMEVTAGLKPGQRIVAAANDGLVEGQHVGIATVEPSAQTTGG